MELTNAFGPDPEDLAAAVEEHERLVEQISQHQTAHAQAQQAIAAAQQALPNLNIRLAVVETWIKQELKDDSPAPEPTEVLNG